MCGASSKTIVKLAKELIAYKLYNNRQRPVLPKYDLRNYVQKEQCMNT